MRNQEVNARGEQGTVLVIVLLILAAATLLSLQAVTTGTLQARMANAIEEGVSALQAAESAVDYVIDDFVTYQNKVGASTAKVCINETGTTGCNALEGKQAIKFQTGDKLNVYIQKQSAAGRDCVSSPRVAKASSVVAYARFDYAIESEVDRTTNGRGGAHVFRGYTQLSPLAPGETC